MLEVLNNKIRVRILELLDKNKFLKYSDLYKEIGIRSNNFDYHFQQLKELGLIEKTGEFYKLSFKGQSLAPYLEILPKVQPVIAVVLAVSLDNKIVLVKRDKEAFQGYWAIPGGKLKYGETIEGAVKRITKNETGLDAMNSKYIATIQETVVENEFEKHHFILLLHKVRAAGQLKGASTFDLNNLPADIVPSDIEMLKLSKGPCIATSQIICKDNKLKLEKFEVV